MQIHGKLSIVTISGPKKLGWSLYGGHNQLYIQALLGHNQVVFIEGWSLYAGGL